MKKLLPLFTLLIAHVTLAQISFTDSSSSLVNSNVTSGVILAVCDMNGDGLDDIVRLDDASDLEVEYQSAGGTFTRLNYGNIGSGNEWGLAIADVDENGYNDIIAGGAYNSIKLLLANGTGTGYTLSTLGGPGIFVQNMNFADIDNNGTIDIFSCHDDGVSSPYSNNGSGSFTYDLSLINAVSTVPSDNSGNYGSIWTDYDNDGDLDLYIAKCRLGVTNPNDGRRLNLLFQNDGSGNYTDVAASCGLQPLAQSWAAGFEDIDNDGDMDCVIINHDKPSQIMENNAGIFTDITSSSGISTQLGNLGSDGIQVILEDFDNDTFVDILITSRGSNNHALFKNDGDKTFTEVSSPFPNSSNTIQSAAVGDLNNDGFIDVIGGFANGYNSPSSTADNLYLNNGNSNNWSKIKLVGVASNINGIGARIELEGAWGTQIREVRSGESYGIMNSMITHFGLGTATAISKITVKWPSGTEDVLLSPNINEQIELTEGETLSLSNPNLNELKVFPNPFSSQLHIEGLPIEHVKLFDINGKLILEHMILSTGTSTISTSQIPSGVYFLEVQTEKAVKSFKLIKN